MVLASLAGLLGACKPEPAPSPSAEPPQQAAPSAATRWVPVKSARDATPEELPAKVLVSPGSEAVVVPPLPARVLAVLKKPGDRVAEGDPIVRVLMPDVDVAVAAKSAAEGSLTVLRKRRERLASLESEGLTRAADVAALDLEIARLEGEALRATAILRGAELREGGVITLRAPLAGLLVELTAIQGELRGPEDGPLARVRARAGARVEASFATEPEVGAEYAFRPLASESSVPVHCISATPRPGGAGFIAWFDAKSADALPPAGTEGRLLMRVADARAFVVPASALGERNGERFLVVRARGGPPAPVPVSLVRIVEGDAIVRGPLTEGALIAEDPHRGLASTGNNGGAPGD